MIDVSSSFELEIFEQVEAAPGTALLRVVARASASLATSPQISLLVGDGDRVHRFARLPAPPDPGGLVRAAFSAPAQLLEGQVIYQLEFSDGSVIELPTPARSQRRIARPKPSTAPESHDTAAVLEQRRLLIQIVELEAELHLARQAQAEFQVQLVHDADARSVLELALATREALIAERDTELEQRAEELENTRERLEAEALEVGRHFEHEAAAREEAVRLAETLRDQLEASVQAERQARDEAAAAARAVHEAETQLDRESAAAERIREQAARDVQLAREAESAHEAARGAVEEAQALRKAAARSRQQTDPQP